MEAPLGARVHGELEQGKVECVGGGFVAGEDEDKGVAEDFVVGEELPAGLGRVDAGAAD